MQIMESGELYLETILVLSEKSKAVRSVDIAEEMGFSKPSVSRAVSLLRNGGFIDVDEKGFITLLDEGRELAEKIFERHTVLTACLKALGISEDTAAEDACKIEHDISDESFEAIKKYYEKALGKA